ncbi:MAG: S-layer homology domain-containing protein [Bacillota bacterium]
MQMGKRCSSALVVVGLIGLLGLFTQPVMAATGFTDLNGHWSQGSVQELVDQGIIGGYHDGTFRPDNPIPRGEFLAVLVKALNIPETGAKVPYQDVKPGSWAEKYIKAAYASGMLDGYGKQFDPSTLITRGEIARITALALKDRPFSRDAQVFPDVSAKLNPYVQTAYRLGVVNGQADGTFGPTDTATRAEAAVMVVRAMKVPAKPQTVTETAQNIKKAARDYMLQLALVPLQKIG